MRLWNDDIEAARAKYGWTNEETAAVYNIATGIMVYLKEEIIKGIRNV